MIPVSSNTLPTKSDIRLFLGFALVFRFCTEKLGMNCYTLCPADFDEKAETCSEMGCSIEFVPLIVQGAPHHREVSSFQDLFQTKVSSFGLQGAEDVGKNVARITR